MTESAAAPDPRYPTGRFRRPDALGAGERADLVERLAALPAAVRAAVAGLDDRALDTPYRSGGWTLRQVVHHLPDSHLNAYVRFKLAATEDAPAIRPYEEARWAELGDRSVPVEPSLALLEALHARWTAWLRTLTPADWQRVFVHPESGRWTLEQALALYAWHGDHHLAHLRGGRARSEGA